MSINAHLLSLLLEKKENKEKEKSKKRESIHAILLLSLPSMELQSSQAPPSSFILLVLVG
jgi:hypothetical protein